MKIILGIPLVLGGILLTLWGHLLVDIVQAFSAVKDRYAPNIFGYWTIRGIGVTILSAGIGLSIGIL